MERAGRRPGQPDAVLVVGADSPVQHRVRRVGRVARVRGRVGRQIVFFSSRRRHTSVTCDWSSDVCSSDLGAGLMHLYELPLAFALTGLALYTVLGGADFGAGFWQLVAGNGPRADEIRDHAHHAMAPVWEANHVWLIFVLTVVWTPYPAAFGSIASTLSIPLFIAGVGIVMRGGAYALRAGTRTAGEQRRVDTVFALSSVLTPFALGTVIGAIASERVHLGNPGGSLVTSWLNPTSIVIGVLAVASGAYTAAVFLSGDAARHGHGDRALADRFRARALGAGLAAGAIAIGALIVLHFDAERIFRRLTQGVGLPALVASVIAGIATLALVWRRRYEP